MILRPLQFIFLIAASACRDAGPAASSSAIGAAPTGTSTALAPKPPSSGAASAPSSSAPLPQASAGATDDVELLKFTLTSAVKDKEPVDKLDAIAAGERVYAHLRLRNRSDAEQEITLVFKVNGKTRTTHKLGVEPSWSFRTWGYNTMHADDESGQLSVTVLNDAGAVIAEATLPIRKKR